MLSEEDKKSLLKLARTSIEDEFTGKKTKTEKRLGKYGVFVTLTKNNDLRGCIGFVEPIFDIVEGVKKAARAAAFGDPRFRPLQKDELNKVKIEISMLTKPKPIQVRDIIVGKHGLIIESMGSSGLLLPQVATEHNMNKEEFLEALCQKAGLPKNSWKNKNVKIYSFEAIVFSEN